MVGLFWFAAASPALAQAQRLPVVASFSILGDMARQIGGERVEVTDIVAPNQDAHVFQPSPADIRKVGAARVILVNGLGFEPAVDRMVSSARLKSTVVSAGVTPLREAASHPGHGHGAKGAPDPHAWQSVGNAKLYARAIAAALVAADVDGKAAYETNLAAYLAKLDALDAEIRAAIAALPADRRAFATTHDALGYFAAAYGVTIHTLQGVSTESEPSAGDLARLIRKVKALKAPAVFLENVTDPRKAQTIARETGAKLGGTLFSDSLSLATGPAPTYIDMMRHNVREIAKALAP